MTFRPMTYLVSFTLFVMLFTGLGVYIGYGRIADHFLTQSFLDATPIDVHVLADQKGQVQRWEEQLPLANGVSVRISANNRALAVSIDYSDEPGPTLQPAARIKGIPLAAGERVEDVRVDKAQRCLYARVFAASHIGSKEATWLYKYDLQHRRLLRRTAVNPMMLPAPFRP